MALTVTVATNPNVPATSLIVTWDFTPDQFSDPPAAVSVTEFDAAGNQLEATGQFVVPPLSGSAIFTRLTPDTTYYYEFCTYAPSPAGEVQDCSDWNAYSGRTAPSPPPPPPPPPPPKTEVRIVTVHPFPAHLFKPMGIPTWEVMLNGLSLTWQASGPIDGLTVELYASSGARVKGINYGGSPFPATSGTVADFGVPMPVLPGTTYSVAIQGNLQGGQLTDWSPLVGFTAPVNSHSLRGFLSASGLNGSNGIKQFLAVPTPGNPLSLRAIMEI